MTSLKPLNVELKWTVYLPQKQHFVKPRLLNRLLHAVRRKRQNVPLHMLKNFV